MQSRRVITDHEKRVVAYHEAGHALCSELLPSVEKVHRISIIPRGKALGYTLNLPEEDRYLKTKDELIDYLVVLLGGPRDRAHRLRPDHHRRLRRPAQGPRDQPLDGHPVRHGHRAEVQAAADRRLLDVRLTRAAWSTRSSSTSPTWPTGARWSGDRAPRAARGASRRPCSRTRCSSARTSSASGRATTSGNAERRRARAGRSTRAERTAAGALAVE